jgi:hypothetical protein
LLFSVRWDTPDRVLTAAALILAQAAPAPALAVRAEDPIGGCPLGALLPGALAAALATAGASSPLPTITVRVRPGPRGAAVTLTSPEGAPLLRRVVPGGAPACAPFADAIAVVVERYVRDLGWRPEPAPVADDDLATPRPSPFRLDDGGAGRLEARAQVGAQGGPGSARASLAAGIGARWRRGPFEAHALVGGSLPEEARLPGTYGGVGVRYQTLRALAGPGVCWPSARRGLCVAGLGGVERLAASTGGDVMGAQTRTAARFHPAFALQGRGEWALSAASRQSLFLAATALGRLSPPRIAVRLSGTAGAWEASHQPARAVGFVELGWGVRFF